MYCNITILIILSFSIACQNKNLSDPIALRREKLERILQSDLPVLALEGNDLLNAVNQKKVLKSKNFTHFLFDPRSGKPLLNEVLSISSVRPSDIHPSIEICKSKSCARMEVYNYALNGTMIIVVDQSDSRMIHSNYYPSMQGDLNEELSELALDIAIADAEVQKQYGPRLSRNDGVMYGTKTALNRTKCQRSKHLCAAPTFIKGDKAMWVIVDLTDLEVVGIEWTHLGDFQKMNVTERGVQNKHIMNQLCDRERELSHGDWAMKYSMTRSDGLKISDIEFQGTPIVQSIKTVDWHVSYSERKGFGYSDAIGCPMFSMAAVVAIDTPSLDYIMDSNDTLGFVLTQSYFSQDWPMPCAYNYRQSFEFYRNGDFRPKVASIGRGCGIDGTYRPVTRIAFAGNKQEVSKPFSDKWIPVEEETWFRAAGSFPFYENKYASRILSSDYEYLIEANLGQFSDGGRGDAAFIYYTKNLQDRPEGEDDLPTIGPCCNTDHRQGPEKFIDSESLSNSEIVMWYVPELKNDGRSGNEYCWAELELREGKLEPKIFPCFSGPKFVKSK